MIKLVVLLTRRPGMSREEFVDYYESTHARIGEKYLTGRASRYTRRYLNPAARPGDPAAADDPDVILEMWFEDEDTYKDTMRVLQQPEVRAEIVADEERVFDRSKIRRYLVEEHESDVTGPPIS